MSHSARVELALEIDGHLLRLSHVGPSGLVVKALSVAKVGPDRLFVAEPCHVPGPCDGVLTVSVDGHETRRTVRLGAVNPRLLWLIESMLHNI